MNKYKIPTIKYLPSHCVITQRKTLRFVEWNAIRFQRKTCRFVRISLATPNKIPNISLSCISVRRDQNAKRDPHHTFDTLYILVVCCFYNWWHSNWIVWATGSTGSARNRLAHIHHHISSLSHLNQRIAVFFATFFCYFLCVHVKFSIVIDRSVFSTNLHKKSKIFLSTISIVIIRYDWYNRVRRLAKCEKRIYFVLHLLNWMVGVFAGMYWWGFRIYERNLSMK